MNKTLNHNSKEELELIKMNRDASQHLIETRMRLSDLIQTFVIYKLKSKLVKVGNFYCIKLL